MQDKRMWYLVIDNNTIHGFRVLSRANRYIELFPNSRHFGTVYFDTMKKLEEENFKNLSFVLHHEEGEL